MVKVTTMEIDYSKEDPAKYYRENGYFVFRGLLPSAEIDRLLAQFRKDVLSSKDYFFRQNTDQWEKNIITSGGFAKQSFLNPHHLTNYREFSERCLDIYCLPEVRKALSAVTERPSHALTQSMFFDANTGTEPHQDYYYLDSVPAGNLLAGWFALEDIQEQAGRFYVFPKSHKITFDLNKDEAVSNEAYLKKIAKWFEENKSSLRAPALKKGDVLFWNSKTIHGALPTTNGAYSRKSLTAHYLPSGFKFGNMWGELAKPIEYFDYKGMNCRLNEKQYSLQSVAKYKVKHFLDRHPLMRRMVTNLKTQLGDGGKRSNL
jgi:phytanoyl-CoA hydroxylase